MKIGPFARPSPWTYRADEDDRSDAKKLEVAIERHLANAALRRSLTAPPMADDAPGSVATLHGANVAYDDSQAVLFRLVEDVVGVDPVRLGKALTA